MAFTYDPTNEAGQIRLLIPDRVEASAVFQDAEIEQFLVLEGSVRRAAALALETLASEEATILKVIKILDVQTDGAKLAEALMSRAAKLRSQATDAEIRAGLVLDWAELVTNEFSAVERAEAQAILGL